MTPNLYSLRIVVINSVVPPEHANDPAAWEQAERARLLRIGLLQAGYNIIASLPADAFVAERIAQLQPDMIVVDAESDARDALEHVVMATRDAPRPIVLFTDDHDQATAQQAIAAGVSAYVVAGLQPERVQPVLEVAMARFQHEQSLLAELHDAKTKLSERKVVERAKGVLMNRHQLTEEQAYQRLRKQAMEKGMRLAELAQRILDVADLI
ncbi:ANTAR domain-containing response regulator [Parvibium lacunae]|uniref:ANTAR domain-containing protein n=1 Tax=Parvibium lacunae TaxID=1888893 RepID=A0A368L4E5_9BURK|nr:ANTAR domain-containing protein [Parvibium lacunae]RCS58456.1 ANTAR domain-containing protein [Parvibium lacunae]